MHTTVAALPKATTNTLARISRALADTAFALLVLASFAWAAIQTQAVPWPLVGVYAAIGVVALLLNLADPRAAASGAPSPLALALLAVQVALLVLATLRSPLPETGVILTFVLRRISHYGGEQWGVAAGAAMWALVAALLLARSGTGALPFIGAWAVVLWVMLGRVRAELRERAGRERTERLLRELEASHLQLQRAAAQAEQLSAARERNRIARDIHDSLGHSLTALSVQLEQAIVQLDHHAPDVRPTLVVARQLAGEALSEVRRSVATFRGADAQFVLADALERLVASARGLGLFEIALATHGDLASLPAPVAVALYRVVQEALTNAQRHSGAAHVWLEVSRDTTAVHLCVRDDGRGFVTHGATGGHGLRGMRERIALLGGTLTLANAPGGGAEVRATIPLANAPARPA